MENKKAPNFFLVIMAIILGITLFKKFDFENLKFTDPVAIVYIISFGFLVYLLIRDYKKSTKK